MKLKQGADPTQQYSDESLSTPLHGACSYGFLECVKLIVETGIQYSRQTSMYSTPIRKSGLTF